MKCPKFLRGAQADRFVFLLETGYSFEDALKTMVDAKLFEEAQKKFLIEVVRARGDTWLLEQLESPHATYGLEFRNAFIRYSGGGNSVEDALEYAERRANTKVSLWRGENAFLPPSKIECPKHIKMVICSTNRLVINEEQYQILMLKLSKPLKKITDLSEMPNIVGFYLVPDPGYIQVICADKFSIEYITKILSRIETWPNASLCVMHEKKYLESQIFSVCMPDVHASKDYNILKKIKMLNPGLEATSWTILTREPMPDYKRTTTKLHILIPRDDGAAIERAGFELTYMLGKVKFTIPNQGAEVNNRFPFTGEFPDSATLPMGKIFKIIAQENKKLCTKTWSFLQRKNFRTEMRKFFVDQRSAEKLKQMNYEINYKSGKIKLVPLEPLSEYRKTTLGPLSEDGNATDVIEIKATPEPLSEDRNTAPIIEIEATPEPMSEDVNPTDVIEIEATPEPLPEDRNTAAVIEIDMLEDQQTVTVIEID